MKKMKEGISFFKPNLDESHSIPLTSNNISAGFPSPADDFKEIRISLDREIIKNEEATFYARVDGESMLGAGLNDCLLYTSPSPRDQRGARVPS